MTHTSNSTPKTLTQQSLELDPVQEIDRLCAMIADCVHTTLRRNGGVVGVSGGIDSSVVLALAVRALGADRVISYSLPERESSPDSIELAQRLAEHYRTRFEVDDITPALEGAGCYRRRDEAMCRIFPDYGAGWKAKISLPGNLLDQDTLNIFHLIVYDPDGVEYSRRLPTRELLQIVAATNFKQRTRMSALYYHAESNHYAVVGTANKNEHGLGFFVKYGDGGVDLQPIGHLFKSQVYMLAAALDVPLDIQQRTPTTDTYSAGSTQEEFFYRVPFKILDLVWYGMEAGYTSEAIGQALDLSADQVERVVADIRRKQRTTAYLRQAPVFMEG